MLVSPAAVEERMRQLCLGEGDDTLGRLAWEHISAGGKRLRARLALSAVQALGGETDDGIGWGAACELLHNASLVHDDIQDGDRFRRGKQALWVRHGVAQAINAGDLCITLGYLALAATPGPDALRWQLALAMARSSRRIVEGQASELRLLTHGIPVWSEYASCVEGKTSALFALPIEGAALIAGRSPDEAAAIAAACGPVGLLFQMQDDVLDLYGDNGREMRGTDLAQARKTSALVVEHLRLYPGDRPWLVGVLSAPRSETPRSAIEAVIARFDEGGALAAVWGRIDSVQAALQSSPALAREPALRELIVRFVPEVLRAIAHTRRGGAL